MVKFSKELEAQLIPEWKDAFVNYWQLKKHIKNIKLSRKPKHDSRSGCTIFVLIDRISWPTSNRGDKREIIQSESEIKICQYENEEREIPETEHLQLFEVRVFVELLDEELRKVNDFYNAKESDFVERRDLLNKQLEILLDLKRVMSERRRKNATATKWDGDSGIVSRSCSSLGRKSDFSIEQCLETMSPINSQPTPSDVPNVTEATSGNSSTRGKPRKGKPVKMGMRIEIPATTPAATIAAATSILWEDLVKSSSKGGKEGERINRKKIQCAEKMIRGAFVELYKGLGLLKTYSSLNMMAFTKIVKKFDKVSEQQALATSLRIVKSSNFISSDKVVSLMDDLESLFTQHFANSDRKKAMKFLRPRTHKSSHGLTFLVGLFTGCSMTLFFIYVILAHGYGTMPSPTQAAHVEVVYPLLSMFGLLSLHVFMYGCDLLMWKTTRINQDFIFDFQASNALKHRDAFLICTSMMTAVVGALLLHLILLSSSSLFSRRVNDFIPGIFLLCFFILLICPFKVSYRPTRYCFIRVLRNIVCAPFYKVSMVDVFMADQLTSQIPLLRYMESAVCYSVATILKMHIHQTCKSGQLSYVISFAPYYWRVMQCTRRWIEERNLDHLANMGKYLSAMVAAGSRITYANQPTELWRAAVLVTSFVATVYQLYWDFVKDWGVLNLKSKNPWLRDHLVLKNRGVYYGSIALNLVLRVAWLETVMKLKCGTFESRMLDFCLASLEVIRRGHWNLYRLENEHLNNVGKFKAVKISPLPFREIDPGA